MSRIGQRDMSAFTTDSVSVVDSSLDPTVLDDMNDNRLENFFELAPVRIQSVG